MKFAIPLPTLKKYSVEYLNEKVASHTHVMTTAKDCSEQHTCYRVTFPIADWGNAKECLSFKLLLDVLRDCRNRY